MFSLDGSSASASSPYSNMSTTDSSSPEASGDQKPNIMRYEQGKGDENRMSGMNLNGYQNNFHNPQVKPESQRTSPIRSVNPQSLTTLSLLQQADSRRPLSTVSSSHAGTRSEHPKRQIELSSDIPVINPSLNELGQTSSMNRLLLQGDPQFIDKQRVETAIRVILDLLRLVPATKSTPTLSPQLQTMMHRDGNGNLTTSVAKIGTFQAIRLQAGATTKLPSKKQQQAQPIPLEKVLFLETAVHRIGDNGKRVYACKKCRAREAKRRQSKESGLRKKGYEATSGSDSSNQKKAQIKMEPSTEADRQPSRDYITGVNSDQYDAGRTDQMVEEPSWNPHKADWRNEIVLFNTAPEIPIVDGSCNWLPFRVVCYGKCHNEKHGFRITFNLRTHTGEIIATAVTNPIRITDDHKTDSKVKPKADGMSQSSVRGRKGRASVASSRQLSPAPSEGESVQSLSEAGAVLQRQTPSVRAGKPYERPPSQSPLVGTIPMDGQFQSNEPQFHRSMSAASIHSLGSFTSPNNPGDVMAQMQNRASEFPMFNGSGGSGTVSPGALRRPHFGFTPLHTPYDGTVSLPPSSSHSVSNSSVGSPMMMALNLGQDDMLFDGRSPTDLMNGINASSLYNLEQQQQHGSMSPPYRSYANDADIEMSNAVNSGFHGLFDTSSLASLDDTASSFTSYSGALADNASVYSQSGVVPESVAVPEEEEFMDYSACEGVSSTPLTAPTFGTSAQQDIMSANGYNAQISPKQTHQQTQVQDFMSLLSQPMAPVPPPQPAANAPMISTIIPAEGPMAGGTTVAIIGANFTPGLNIMFGDRSARVQRIDPTFIQCQSPPAAIPGSVEVTITGVARSPMGPCLFKYNMMDTDLMRLALQVKDQYAGTTDNAAYRLAQHIAAGTDRSSTSPLSSGLSQNYSMGLNNSAAVDNTDPADDLQLTVINFLASVDKDAPGALRRSGMVNHPTEARQTLLHIATVMGFHRLVRRLIVIGAQLDVQDVNGYTALGLASLMGQVACARVLIEGGASYDRPTLFGEMPLDLAKIGEHPQIEALLLSAVWSTDPTKKEPEPKDNGGFSELTKPILGDAPSEIDNDNPSDSEEEIERVFTAARPRRLSKKARGKRRVSPTASLKESTAGELATTIPLPPTRSISLASGSTNTATESSPLASPTSSPPDLPPPYESHTSTMTSTSSKATSTWSSGDRATVELPLPDSMWSRTITSLLPDKMTHNLENGWVTLPVPAPSWETLQKMTSPEEVKLFTQAMAAAAFNAVVQSGATTSSSLTDVKRKRRKSRNGREDSSSPSRKMVKQVKSDRMLYLFWLPILLFVGFWLLVTALPIATGFCLIYARQITRAIKQRI